MTKLGRNEPCWCGSGLKYKRCHLNRASEAPVTIQEEIDTVRQTFGKKYCVHPKAGNECSGNIVKAHTIQKKGFGLSRIARNGQVYRYAHTRVSGSPSKVFGADLVSITNASTFTGFCSFHDNSTFQEIENNPVQVTEKHTFLLGYRAVAKEVFLKRAQFELRKFLRTLDRGKDAESQRRVQQYVDVWGDLGVAAGLKELEHHRQIYDKALTASDYSDEHYYVMELDQIPDFMCSGTVQPDYDFHGNVLQDWTNTAIMLDHITLSLIATDKGGAAVFSWCGKNEASEKLVKSLHSLADDQIPHALVRYVFENFENVYASPVWWEGLDKATQEKLLARLLSTIKTPRTSSCLKDDGLRVVAWKVTAKKTNLTL